MLFHKIQLSHHYITEEILHCCILDLENEKNKLTLYLLPYIKIMYKYECDHDVKFILKITR